MTSLITEYRTRHNLNCVMSVDEGVTFFNINKKPFAIVLTSSHSRSVTNCRQCLSSKNGGLIGELFVHTNQCYPNQIFSLISHQHLEADVDLVDWANQYSSSKDRLDPFLPSSDLQIESWLWQFFITNNEIYKRKWVNKNETQRFLEQIAWTVDNSGNHQNNPRLYETFYKNFYCRFILGRKYTIYS